MLFFLLQSALAVPQQLSQQGRLLDSAGDPLKVRRILHFLFTTVPSPTHLFGRKPLPYSLAMVSMLHVRNWMLSNPLDSDLLAQDPIFGIADQQRFTIATSL